MEMCIRDRTLTSHVEDVHKFLFGDDGYTISSNITDIEAGIREKCTHKATSDSVIAVSYTHLDALSRYLKEIDF